MSGGLSTMGFESVSTRFGADRCLVCYYLILCYKSVVFGCFGVMISG